MAMRFRQFMHRCHLHYKKFSTKEAPQHPSVHVEPLDRMHLGTVDSKKQSKAGKENGNDLEGNHIFCFNPLTQLLRERKQEKSENDKEPSQVKLNKATHLKKNGTCVHPRAAENHENMEVLKNQPMHEDSSKSTKMEMMLDELQKSKGRFPHRLRYGMKYRDRISSRVRVKEAAHISAEEAERRNKIFFDDGRANLRAIGTFKESQLDLRETIQKVMAQFDE